MSIKKHSDLSFKNEDTVRRRLWIERAVTGARDRLAGDPAGIPIEVAPPRPRLYVVDSGSKR